MSETIDAVGSTGKVGEGRIEYDGMHWSGWIRMWGCIPYRVTAEPRNVDGTRGLDVKMFFAPPRPPANDEAPAP